MNMTWPNDRLIQIFDRQRELMHVYEGIEAENGLLLSDSVPVDLDHRFGQARLKDFAWRFTEELGEAASTLDEKGMYHADTREEVIDAFHFLVELMILAGATPELLVRGCCEKEGISMEETFGDLLDMWYFAAAPRKMSTRHVTFEDIRDGMFNSIQKLAGAMHCLKQRPWKKERLPTDVDKFRDGLVDTFFYFGCLLQTMGLTTRDTFQIYFAKSEVNKRRQTSNY